MRFFNAIGRFFKKNLFYVVLALCIIGVGLGVTFACIYGTRSNNPSIEKPTSGNEQDSSTTDIPTIKEIIFCAPVENGSVLKEYCVTKPVFSTTLKEYRTHSGVDYTGADGAAVVAVYGGTIESVESGNILDGTVITIDHGNGLKTVYKSLLDGSMVTVGKTVAKGEKIGVISTTCRQEYKDGAHVHLEVFENGTRIDPSKYLSSEEK